MMSYTDRHYRFFMRQITKSTLLYSEMLTTKAILHGDKEKLLGYSVEEHPLALQLGGDNPQELAECAFIAEDWGYDEVNLNVGCPSDRVQNGNFGACLMARPQLVAECLAAMRGAVKIPVTIKQRIGIDNLANYEHLKNFVSIVSQAKPARFTIHARKAWLKGLSPKENRTIPPLRYEDVYKLKREFPNLNIEINGGIKTWSQINAHLEKVDAVMIGRAAYENPYLFATADKYIDKVINIPSRSEIIVGMLPYIDYWLQRGLYLKHISKHMLGLFAYKSGTKLWKRYLSENAYKQGAGVEVVLTAMEHIPVEVLKEKTISC